MTTGVKHASINLYQLIQPCLVDHPRMWDHSLACCLDFPQRHLSGNLKWRTEGSVEKSSLTKPRTLRGHIAAVDAQLVARHGRLPQTPSAPPWSGVLPGRTAVGVLMPANHFNASRNDPSHQCFSNMRCYRPHQCVSSPDIMYSGRTPTMVHRALACLSPLLSPHLSGNFGFQALPRCLSLSRFALQPPMLIQLFDKVSAPLILIPPRCPTI